MRPTGLFHGLSLRNTPKKNVDCWSVAVLDDLKGGGAHTMINEDKIQINKMRKPLKRCGVKGEVKSQLLECLKGSQSASIRKISWVKYNSHSHSSTCVVSLHPSAVSFSNV